MKIQEFRPVGGVEIGWISLGAGGLHPLFEADEIRRAFTRIDDGGFFKDGFILAHRALHELGSMKQLSKMREYLDSLPSEIIDLLVFLYFRCVDQFLDQRQHTLH